MRVLMLSKALVTSIYQQKLEELAKPKGTAPADTAAETSKPVDLEKADEKLSSLLGKPK